MPPLLEKDQRCCGQKDLLYTPFGVGRQRRSYYPCVRLTGHGAAKNSPRSVPLKRACTWETWEISAFDCTPRLNENYISRGIYAWYEGTGSLVRCFNTWARGSITNNQEDTGEG